MVTAASHAVEEAADVWLVALIIRPVNAGDIASVTPGLDPYDLAPEMDGGV
jgi:hypothetical protein